MYREHKRRREGRQGLKVGIVREDENVVVSEKEEAGGFYC